MTFDDWLRQGMEHGWCGPAVCQTHDGTPTSEAEDEEFEDGHDPCITVIRPYADIADKTAVENNHAPSVWRRTNMG